MNKNEHVEAPCFWKWFTDLFSAKIILLYIEDLQFTNALLNIFCQSLPELLFGQCKLILNALKSIYFMNILWLFSVKSTIP